MKKEYKAGNYFQKAFLFMSLMLFALQNFAQDKQVDVNINTNKSNGFWGSPWMWVVGAAVFILLLVAILRGGSRRGA